MSKDKKVYYNKSFNVVAGKTVIEERYLSSRTRWHEYTSTLEVPPAPLHIDIELTNFCNLKCVFCQTNHMKRPKGMMSMETFIRIIDECRNIGVDSVKLSLWGEPTLNKKFMHMVRYARDNSSLILQLNTNANTMTPAISRGIVEAGLDMMTISVDGITKETYEKLRKLGNYERLMRNINGLLKAKKEAGSSMPYITLQIIQTKENIHEVKSFVSYWEKLVDRVSVTNIGATKPEAYIMDLSVREEKKTGRQPCEQFWQRLSIYWDGTITVCCG
ncbi:MAG: radical SAM protein, partial [Candidatus Omnitrophica bacterium]|nr:radical SAM protein [Candidatus Omnitrophota bacterium]